jgi:hypothetical protein
MIGKKPLWVAKQHGHSITTMLTVYAAWTEGAVESDINAIRRAMASRPRALERAVGLQAAEPERLKISAKAEGTRPGSGANGSDRKGLGTRHRHRRAKCTKNMKNDWRERAGSTSPSMYLIFNDLFQPLNIGTQACPNVDRRGGCNSLSIVGKIGF